MRVPGTRSSAVQSISALASCVLSIASIKRVLHSYIYLWVTGTHPEVRVFPKARALLKGVALLEVCAFLEMAELAKVVVAAEDGVAVEDLFVRKHLFAPEAARPIE